MRYGCSRGTESWQYGFDLVKGFRDALRRGEVEPLEVSNRLMEIQELLLEMQSSIRDVEDSNSDLKRQLDDRAEKKALAADIGVGTRRAFLREEVREVTRIDSVLPDLLEGRRQGCSIGSHSRSWLFSAPYP